MDSLRSLYKTNLNSPRKCKRKEANEIRANKRSELYISARNISSPSLKKPSEDQKENIKPSTTKNSFCPPTKNDEKISRQKAHLLKFLAWKAEKDKKAQIKEHSKRAPFVVGARKCTTVQRSINETKKPSFAPANHIFRAPASLQNFELKVIDLKSVCLINGNIKETYNFLETPNKKNQKLETKFPHLKPFKNTLKEKSVAKTIKPITKKAIKEQEQLKGGPNNGLVKVDSALPPLKRTNFKAPKPIGSSISTAFMTVTANTNNKLDAIKVKLNGKSVLKVLTLEKASKQIQENHLVNILASTKKKIPPKNLAVEQKHDANSKLPSKIEKLKINPSQVDDKKIPVQKKSSSSSSANIPTLFARDSKTPLKPKPIIDNKLDVTNRVAKLKSSNGMLKPNSDLPPIKRSNFKALKKFNSSNSNAFVAIAGHNRLPNRTAKVKTNLKLAQKNMLQDKMLKKKISETLEMDKQFPFLNVVTSTKRKSLSSKEVSANSLFVEMDQLVSPIDGEVKHSPKSEKFHFLRYSFVHPDNHQEGVKPDELHVTPDKTAKPQTPTTYLSPFVSVSRRKVGIKTEREKRNSVYMCGENPIRGDADTTAKVRHILATVQYYRKQLNDEIERLKGECNTWKEYKNSNLHLLEDVGSDMINVTIGQTNLLITKKLKQFGGLIDRCEDGAVGKKTVGKGDGVEPILTEDLEGFWSMVGLQIENVDKRFANLQRWKENNWKDPDEITTKSTNVNKNQAKMKKIKKCKTAGPNIDLQKILKNAQAEFLRKKQASKGIDEDIILTPSKGRQVIIKDRRSKSAAATIITVNSSKVSRNSSVNEQGTPTGIMADEKMLPHVNGFRKSMNLFKSTLNKAEKTSPIATKWKSILKTPGSVRKNKSVIFNSPKLQFTVEDQVEDETNFKIMSPSKQEKIEEEERTYSLRTRSIKLRDLADIIIPE